MSAAKFLGDDLGPGINFVPEDEELIELYLLPRVRGEADPFPGLIIDDDAAATTQPWALFERHHLPQKDALPAFFYVRTNGARPDARPNRRCDGGGSWKSQKSVGKNKDDSHVLLVAGEKIRWIRHNLNFDMGSGSIGWVMREYSIPDHPSLKVCRISFSGHGHKRTRVPDGYDDNSSLAGQPTTKRARVAAPADSGSDSWTTTTSFDQQDFGTVHASGHQEPSQNDGVEMVAEMTYAQPSWEFQEQPVHMEQPPSSAPQEPAHVCSPDQDPPPASGMTTMINQDSSAGLELDPFEFELPSAEEFEKMMESLADLPDLFQHLGEQAPASTMEQNADQEMPSFLCGVQDIDSMFIAAQGHAM